MTSITCVYTCHYQNKDLAIFDVFDYFNPSISNGSNRFFYFNLETIMEGAGRILGAIQ